MKRTLITVLILLCSAQTHALNWEDLWYTPDQQAQLLMNKGLYPQAKERFQRHDWSAAAAYKAGDYQEAADLFKELHTESAYYNYGNALAHLGRYEDAIKAYDKALTFNPKNKDTLFNRELVKNLLKNNQKNNKQEDKNKDQQNKDRQNKDQQNKDQQNKDQQNKDQQNKDQQNKDQQNKDQQNKDQQNKDQQNKDQQNKDQQNKDQQNKDQQNKDQQNKDQQNKDQQNKEQQNKENHQANQDKNSAKKPPVKAESLADKEKQHAKEQWLRLIPDDPGGLMREKFLRDHLRRERGWYQ